MLSVFIGSLVTVWSGDGQEPYRGTVVDARSPKLLLEFDSPVKFVPEQIVECAVGNGVSFAKVQGRVVSAGGHEAEIWLNIENIQPGNDRSPRAVAPGAVVTLQFADEELTASLCDCSESGMRISCPKPLQLATETDVFVDSGLGPIQLRARVVRVAQGHLEEYVEIGMEIIDGDKLSRARWNHMVASLLKKFGTMGAAA